MKFKGRVGELEEREAKYKEDLTKLAFDKGETVEEIEGSVYAFKDGVKRLVKKPLRPKVIWYEAWLAYKYKDDKSEQTTVPRHFR